MKTHTFHLRRPLPKRRGNQFYRDKRDFADFDATVCGAAVTEYDQPHNRPNRMQDWYDAHYEVERTACKQCRR